MEEPISLANHDNEDSQKEWLISQYMESSSNYGHYEGRLKKHAAEDLRLMKEYEDMKATGCSKKEAF